MRNHKHDWKASEVRAGILGTFEIRLVWFCVRGGCKSTRTEQLRVRKPRADALTDADRSMKEADKRLRKNTLSTDTSSQKQPEQLEELDFHEWLEIEPMVEERGPELIRSPLIPTEPIPQEVVDWLAKYDREKYLEVELSSRLLQGKKIISSRA